MQNSLLNLQRDPGQAPLGMVYASITGRAGAWFFVNSDQSLLPRALKADSCLLEPQVGDKVLLCHGHCEETAYILAVLVQASHQQAELKLPGQVTLSSAEGRLRIQAEQIQLEGSKQVALDAPYLVMSGLLGTLKLKRLDVALGQLGARLGTVRAVAHSVHSTVGRLVQKARDSFRWSERLDETRAGRMRIQVEEQVQLQAERADLQARGQFKIDGQKIDLG